MCVGVTYIQKIILSHFLLIISVQFFFFLYSFGSDFSSLFSFYFFYFLSLLNSFNLSSFFTISFFYLYYFFLSLILPLLSVLVLSFLFPLFFSNLQSTFPLNIFFFRIRFSISSPHQMEKHRIGRWGRKIRIFINEFAIKTRYHFSFSSIISSRPTLLQFVFIITTIF